MDIFAQNLPESVIKRFSIRIRELGGVNLGQGIPSFSTAPHILDAVRTSLTEPAIGVYPKFMGTDSLRTAIADKLNRGLTVGADFNMDNILVTVGAMEAVSVALLSIIKDGEEVGVITPNYCNHFPEIQLARGKIIEIPMKSETEWKLDMEAVAAHAAHGTMKVLLLTNPNNPTGALFEKDELSEMVKLAQKYGFWIIADETYAYLTYENKFTSMLEYYSRYDRLIVVRSFSKEYAMSGWRVGFMVSNPTNINIMSRTHDALTGCAPKISQRAAEAAVTGTQETVEEYVRVLTVRRNLACKKLDEMSEFLSYLRPQGAYYIFLKYKTGLDSMAMGEKLLNDAKVALIPGVMFGKSGEGYLRMSYAGRDEDIIQGLLNLRAYLLKL